MTTPRNTPKVAIVANNASALFGGEAILPLHYFRHLRIKKYETYLVVHERVKSELDQLLPNDVGNIHYVKDSFLQKFLWKIGLYLPKRVATVTVGVIIGLLSEFKQRSIVKKLIREGKVNLVHQPTPVSPKQPSILFSLGAPVVIGPMNGGMDFPSAFKHYESFFSKTVLGFVRLASSFVNVLLPGKRKAALLLVANERTRKALPTSATKNVQIMPENAVDLKLWELKSNALDLTQEQEVPSFVYLGRLISLKAIDILLESLAIVLKEKEIKLKIIGDGEEKENLILLSKQLKIDHIVEFSGFQPQAECVEQIKQARSLILPSLCECGGAVVLEAMAMETAVIATDWGGPQDYITDESGILIKPLGRKEMVSSLAKAILSLANNEQLAKNMGTAGRQRVEKYFCWNKKVDVMIGIYENTLGEYERKQPFRFLK